MTNTTLISYNYKIISIKHLDCEYSYNLEMNILKFARITDDKPILRFLPNRLNKIISSFCKDSCIAKYSW